MTHAYWGFSHCARFNTPPIFALVCAPAEIARQVKGGAEDHNLPSALYAPQPQEDAGVMYADYLAELTPAGETVWEWRSWEHFDPVADGIAEVQALRTLWAMGNSILELPNGDILASYRPTSTVIRIDRKTSNIIWKLGPPTLAGQHAPTPLENGNILIFDNGVPKVTGPITRPGLGGPTAPATGSPHRRAGCAGGQARLRFGASVGKRIVTQEMVRHR